MILAAAGPATFVAIASVAPALFATLVGPYHWVTTTWSAAPANSRAELGKLAGLADRPMDIVTAVLMTATLTLGAIGFGGPRATVAGRAAAVITPGVAATLLSQSPDLTPSRVIARLRDASIPAPGMEGEIGGGLLDMARLFQP